MLPLLNWYCWRRRGIGIIGICRLYPGRATNEIAGILIVRANAPSINNAGFELGRWRPWRTAPRA
jgi:hypothetical protein